MFKKQTNKYIDMLYLEYPNYHTTTFHYSAPNIHPHTLLQHALLISNTHFCLPRHDALRSVVTLQYTTQPDGWDLPISSYNQFPGCMHLKKRGEIKSHILTRFSISLSANISKYLQNRYAKPNSWSNVCTYKMHSSST